MSKVTIFDQMCARPGIHPIHYNVNNTLCYWLIPFIYPLQRTIQRVYMTMQKSHLSTTTTTINSQVNCNVLYLFVLGSDSALWLAKASTATHIPGDTANHRLYRPSYLICMCISARQNLLANQICVLYTRKPCPVVGELASLAMEGTVYSVGDSWW